MNEFFSRKIFSSWSSSLQGFRVMSRNLSDAVVLDVVLDLL